MLVSFLGIEAPAAIPVLDMLLDPLAVLSILLACLQPFGILFLRRIFSGGGNSLWNMEPFDSAIWQEKIL